LLIGQKARQDHLWCERLKAALRLPADEREKAIVDLMNQAVDLLIESLESPVPSCHTYIVR
jgi:hypothetical protein